MDLGSSLSNKMQKRMRLLRNLRHGQPAGSKKLSLSLDQRGGDLHAQVRVDTAWTVTGVWLRLEHNLWFHPGDAARLHEEVASDNTARVYMVDIDIAAVLANLLEALQHSESRGLLEMAADAPVAVKPGTVPEADDPVEQIKTGQLYIGMRLYLEAACRGSAMPGNAIEISALDADGLRAAGARADSGTHGAAGIWTGSGPAELGGAGTPRPPESGDTEPGDAQPGDAQQDDTQQDDTQQDDQLYSGRFPWGQFAETRIGELSKVSSAMMSAHAYVDRRGNIAIAVNRDLKPYNRVHVHRLRIRHGHLRMRGRLYTRHGDAVRADLVLTGRQSGFRVGAPVTLVLDTEATGTHYGLRRYRFDADYDFAALIGSYVSTDQTVDAWLEVWDRGAAEPHRVRIGQTRYLVRLLSRQGWARRGGDTMAITPYYTFKAKKTSFTLEIYDAEAFKYLRRHTKLPGLARLHGLARMSKFARRSGKERIWLVGEKPNKAQDTGLHFFRYLREQHPEISAYYVIDPASPEAKNLDGLGHVVAHRSRRHIELALKAERFIGSHHPDFLYPTRAADFKRSVRGVKVFLQHGVMGTKWMVPNYGKRVAGFDTDLFLVSSEREKEYIVEDFGYDPAEVAVTGLSRFDALFADDVEPQPSQLLIIPTWRDWLQDPERFLESEYFKAWSGFLYDDRLRTLATERGLDVVFCLHPNMQQFRHFFDGVPARIIVQGETDVQQLLKQSALMVTDYSSVGFDFSFLKKPVIYFQFDRNRFLGPSGSHLDLDVELPGRIVSSHDELIDAVAARLDDDSRMEPEYAQRADRFLTYRDRHNCDRIFDRIDRAAVVPGLRKSLVNPEFLETSFRVWRRSRYYFPMMKAMFRAVSRLPLDEGIVVFESGVGKQYADSPRYIYEELLRRSDARTKVWAYNGRFPVKDPGTIVVKRLSPGYYWYLARAKYWVNNQNFPYYIRRRPKGVYLQTWHGTPLKRMLHDLDEIHGRDEGYLDRVTTAAAQWSVLLSPSPFTTEKIRSAFRYTGRVLETGYPRNDILLAPERDRIAADVRDKLGIGPGKKVFLYAPTFRDNQSAGAGRFKFTLPLDLEAFNARFGEDSVLLLRTHVLVSGSISIPEDCAHAVIDASSYPEIQELYLASDVLITDYSSVFFDYSILRRPILFYAYDLDLYRDQLRGFYLDYDTELPGPVVTTEDALYEELDKIRTGSATGPFIEQGFIDRYAPYDDGGASARAVDNIFGRRL